jgi:hypothetical protein
MQDSEIASYPWRMEQCKRSSAYVYGQSWSRQVIEFSRVSGGSCEASAGASVYLRQYVRLSELFSLFICCKSLIRFFHEINIFREPGPFSWEMHIFLNSESFWNSRLFQEKWHYQEKGPECTEINWFLVNSTTYQRLSIAPGKFWFEPATSKPFLRLVPSRFQGNMIGPSMVDDYFCLPWKKM